MSVGECRGLIPHFTVNLPNLISTSNLNPKTKGPDTHLHLLFPPIQSSSISLALIVRVIQYGQGLRTYRLRTMQKDRITKSNK